MSRNVVQGALSRGRTAGTQARPQTVGAGDAPIIRFGEITATEPGGTYAVGLYDDSENIAAYYTTVFAVPDASLSVGDQVRLIFYPGKHNPTIDGQGLGSGCGNTFQSFHEGWAGTRVS